MSSRAEIIAGELRDVHDALGEAVLVAVPRLVQLNVSRGKYARLILQAHFPSTYPRGALSCELKSNTLPVSAVKRLEELADSEAEACAEAGEVAVLRVHGAVAKIVRKNLLLVAYDEVKALRTRYKPPDVKIETKDVKGEVRVSVTSARYETVALFKVPASYPTEPCEVVIESSDCPPSLVTIFDATTREVGRKLIRPEPKRPPVVAHTLQAMIRFYIDECSMRYPKETCQLCKRRMLPEVGERVPAAARPKAARVVRVYCSHLFHAGCLRKYLETPPFDKGKLCPHAGCGKRIYHQNFKTAGNIKLAESRWAHREAHKREIREVAEFMAIDDDDRNEEEDDDNFGAFY